MGPCGYHLVNRNQKRSGTGLWLLQFGVPAWGPMSAPFYSIRRRRMVCIQRSCGNEHSLPRWDLFGREGAAENRGWEYASLPGPTCIIDSSSLRVSSKDCTCGFSTYAQVSFAICIWRISPDSYSPTSLRPLFCNSHISRASKWFQLIFSSAVTRFGEVSSARRRLAKGKSDLTLACSHKDSELGAHASCRTSQNLETSLGCRNIVISRLRTWVLPRMPRLSCRNHLAFPYFATWVERWIRLQIFGSPHLQRFTVIEHLVSDIGRASQVRLESSPSSRPLRTWIFISDLILAGSIVDPVERGVVHPLPVAMSS